MLKIGDFPIKKKLTWMNMLVGGGALLIACAAFVIYELATQRSTMVQNLSLQAQIAGQNCASAILFDDPAAARTTLGAFSAAPHILFAGVYTPSGMLFADYRRDAGGNFPAPPSAPAGLLETSRLTRQSLTLARPIVLQGKLVGLVYLVSDRQEENQRLAQYGQIVGEVLLISLLAAWALSSVVQKTTAQPIMQLANTARIVSRERRYSVRAPTTGNHDEIGVLIESFNDMLEQIQARDAALQQAHERLHLALQSSGVGTWNWSAADGIVVWDDYMYPLFGIDAKNFSGRLDDILELIHPLDHERARRAVRQLDAGAHFEFRRIWPDGSVHWVAARGSVRRDAEGRPTRMAGACWDITERRQAEEDKQKFVSLVEQTDDFVAIADLGGRLLYLNSAGRALAGLETENVENTFFADLYPEEWQSKLRDDILPDIVRSGKNWVGESRLRNPSSRQPTDVYMNVFPVNDPETGLRLCLAAVVRDITARKQLEEQLRQAQKLESIGQLAGGVAHDFNNLLTVISGYAQLIAADFARDHPIRESTDEIRHAADRASGLTRQLLAFARRDIAIEQNIPINDLVRNIEKMLRRLIGADVSLVLALDENAGSLRADPGQIEQVIMNLVVNARDAMPEGGTVRIETSRLYADEEFARSHLSMAPGEYVLLLVSDTGAGMSPEVKSRIFEPFFTTKETGKGTGLGLSMVYGIVKQSRGYISVYSEVDLGSSFKLYFPAVEGGAAEEEATALELTDALSGNETILLAEDEAGVRGYVRTVLERHGYHVLAAANGNEAIEKIASYTGPIDLLLTDVVMPEAGGVEVAARFASAHPGAPILYMSGYTHRVPLPEKPETNLIHKPFASAALLMRLRELLDHRATQQTSAG
jgi:PAS domain S-box-containing protein